MESPTPQAIAQRFGLKNVSPVPGDASLRLYFRGNKGAKSVIVMLYPDASEGNRAELKRFCDINDKLAGQGIKVAEIYETDEGEVCALLEDLGTQSFGKCLRNESKSAESLYKLAVKALIQTRGITQTSDLPPYKKMRIYANRRQLIDYYMTLKQGRHPGEECVNNFNAIWDEIEKALPPCPQGFVHGDYHLENLIYTGTGQCALIDYQDAFYGPLPYDLVNLLEDARIDVSQDLRSAMMKTYTKDMPTEEKEAFMLWYRVLAVQFHGRVIGLFIKLAVEQNRDSYLVHIPRLQNYLTESLKAPVLEPLKKWFAEVKLDFQPITPLDGQHVRAAFKKN